ncbi:hypothetical protein Hamer_G027061 [Homarus americanus]|uniref:Uncharacterized protein n=1 Tax=Homarus americanus TaxID=6706 RepID=A0A8J5JRF1_HOMAM|nr:hypothetical protein Hamer_G027061 [Homarus americanus]
MLWDCQANIIHCPLFLPLKWPSRPASIVTRGSATPDDASSPEVLHTHRRQRHREELAATPADKQQDIALIKTNAEKESVCEWCNDKILPLRRESRRNESRSKGRNRKLPAAEPSSSDSRPQTPQISFGGRSSACLPTLLLVYLSEFRISRETARRARASHCRVSSCCSKGSSSRSPPHAVVHLRDERRRRTPTGHLHSPGRGHEEVEAACCLASEATALASDSGIAQQLVLSRTELRFKTSRHCAFDTTSSNTGRVCCGCPSGVSAAGKQLLSAWVQTPRHELVVRAAASNIWQNIAPTGPSPDLRKGPWDCEVAGMRAGVAAATCGGLRPQTAVLSLRSEAGVQQRKGDGDQIELPRRNERPRANDNFWSSNSDCHRFPT